MRILILNIFSRNALAAINSLDPSFELYGAAEEKKRTPFGLDSWWKSRRLVSILRHPDPATNFEGFINSIAEFCNQQDITAVIPAGDQIIRYASQAKQQLASKTSTILLTEDYDKFVRISDKWLTTRTCEGLDVPCPKSLLVKSSPSFVDELKAFTFPIVVKPRSSHASKGVEFFNSLDEFSDWHVTQEATTLGDEENPRLMIQEAIEGSLHDVALVAHKGKTMATFSQRRIAGLYDFGGGGIVNITTDEPEIINYAKKIAASLEWNGVCEFDFMRTADDRYFLLECNPRLWGTTQLSTEAGLNVVQMLVDIFVSQKQIEPITDYHKGLLYRWWFPEMLYHLVQPPLTPNRLMKRLRITLSPYESNEIRSNLEIRNFRHFIGMALNKICH